VEASVAEREVKASEFKDQCLELIDEVARTGDTLVVTRRGRPVVRIGPVAVSSNERDPIGFMKGQMALADPNDKLLSAWDDEIDAAFEDGLRRTADLINPPAKKKVRKAR
jgi:prevent-host-death family protein